MDRAFSFGYFTLLVGFFFCEKKNCFFKGERGSNKKAKREGKWKTKIVRLTISTLSKFTVKNDYCTNSCWQIVTGRPDRGYEVKWGQSD